MKIEKLSDYLKIIREEMPDLDKYGSTWAMSIYQERKGVRSLNEMLTSSVDFNVLKKQLNSLNLNFIDIKFKYNEDEYSISINKENLTPEAFQLIDDKLKAMSWFMSVISIYDLESNEFKKVKPLDFKTNYMSNYKKINRYLEITLEPKFDTVIDNSRIENLYHISFDLFHKNIMKQGLIPKNKNKLSEHPSRIYLLMNATDPEIKNLAQQLLDKYKNKKLVERVYVYKIKVGPKSNYKFMEDINLRDGGVYTNENILKHMLEVYMEGNVEEEECHIYKWNK